ncbi:hypothetical protein BU16DRAFT_567642 [Lophium mytilinum]|uniref:Uncharacterized protein n=1 Tax=Lophium mytilinum TaxID=390894 RepID=A0A6A6QAJ2_9PEZI|nr:hypothetical protein BU16DRAFT_567642 [Lophium mytilinum]
MEMGPKGGPEEARMKALGARSSPKARLSRLSGEPGRRVREGPGNAPWSVRNLAKRDFAYVSVVVLFLTRRETKVGAGHEALSPNGTVSGALSKY